jgi:hypothetical protein
MSFASPAPTAPAWLPRAFIAFVLGAVAATRLALTPHSVLRELLPTAAFLALVARGGAPRTLHLNLAPARCDGGGNGTLASPRIHLVLATFGYADKLNVTLFANMRALGPALGTVFIMTKADDDRTVAVAEAVAARAAAGAASGRLPAASIELWQSDIFTHKGAKLNRAGALRFLQQHLEDDCTAARLPGVFVLMLDVDILLPKNFWATAVPEMAAIESASALSGHAHDTMFSMERGFFYTPSDALLLREGPCPEPFRGGCEAFLGYFQLYSAAAGPRYDEWSNDVSLADQAFRDTFGRRHLLKGRVMHLGQAGVNWDGRSRENVNWWGTEIDY